MPSIEDHIREAIGDGKFDNLPGQGKPLRLDDNPHANPEWRLAHHMLHSSGYTLPWIALRQEIEGELEAARMALQHAWRWRQKGLAVSTPVDQVEAEWQRARTAFEGKLATVNRMIADYNIQAPSDKFQLALRKVEREVAAITDAE